MARHVTPTTHPNLVDGITVGEVLARRKSLRAQFVALNALLPVAGCSQRKRIKYQIKPLSDELHAIGHWLRVHRPATATDQGGAV